MSLLAQTYHKDVKYILNNKTHVKTVWHGSVKIWPMAKFYIINSGEEELEYTVEDIPATEYESVLATSIKLRSQKSDVVLPFYYICSEGIALTGSFNAPNAAVTPSITNLNKYGASGYIDSNPTRSASSDVIPDMILKWKVKSSAIKDLYIDFTYPGRDYTINADEVSSINTQLTDVNINIYSDAACTKLITSAVAESVNVVGYPTNTNKIHLDSFVKKIEIGESDTLNPGDTVYCAISFSVSQKDRTFTVTPTQTSGSGSYTLTGGKVDYTWEVTSPKSGTDYSWSEITLSAKSSKDVVISITGTGTPDSGYAVSGSPQTTTNTFVKLPIAWNPTPTITTTKVSHTGTVTIPATTEIKTLLDNITFNKRELYKVVVDPASGSGTIENNSSGGGSDTDDSNVYDITFDSGEGGEIVDDWGVAYDNYGIRITQNHVTGTVTIPKSWFTKTGSGRLLIQGLSCGNSCQYTFTARWYSTRYDNYVEETRTFDNNNGRDSIELLISELEDKGITFTYDFTVIGSNVSEAWPGTMQIDFAIWGVPTKKLVKVERTIQCPAGEMPVAPFTPVNISGMQNTSWDPDIVPATGPARYTAMWGSGNAKSAGIGFSDKTLNRQYREYFITEVRFDKLDSYVPVYIDVHTDLTSMTFAAAETYINDHNWAFSETTVSGRNGLISYKNNFSLTGNYAWDMSRASELEKVKINGRTFLVMYLKTSGLSDTYKDSVIGSVFSMLNFTIYITGTTNDTGGDTGGSTQSPYYLLYNANGGSWGNYSNSNIFRHNVMWGSSFSAELRNVALLYLTAPAGYVFDHWTPSEPAPFFNQEAFNGMTFSAIYKPA